MSEQIQGELKRDSAAAAAAADSSAHAASSPTSILPRRSAPPRVQREVHRRIFVPDDKAKRGMSCEEMSPSSVENTPRKKSSAAPARSRDLPRRILLPGDVTPKKRPAPASKLATSKRRKSESHVQVVETEVRIEAEIRSDSPTCSGQQNDPSSHHAEADRQTPMHQQGGEVQSPSDSSLRGDDQQGGQSLSFFPRQSAAEQGGGSGSPNSSPFRGEGGSSYFPRQPAAGHGSGSPSFSPLRGDDQQAGGSPSHHLRRPAAEQGGNGSLSSSLLGGDDQQGGGSPSYFLRRPAAEQGGDCGSPRYFPGGGGSPSSTPGSPRTPPGVSTTLVLPPTPTAPQKRERLEKLPPSTRGTNRRLRFD